MQITLKQIISIDKFARKRKIAKYKRILKGIFEKKAEHVLAIDISKHSGYADFLILCTANSIKHAQTIADKIIMDAKKSKLACIVEGYQLGEWILVDIGSVVIHIFLEDIRKIYDIEGLWHQADSYFIEDIQHISNE